MNRINENAVNIGFGKMADEYDAIRETNTPVKRMREKLYEIVLRKVSPPASMLELNCGSGIDAQFYAGQGYKILAADISDKMLKNASEKGISANFSFVKLNLTEIEKLYPNKYDVIISNLGGLNCLDDLSPLNDKIKNLLNDNGYFIAVVMPQFSLWEFLLLFKGKFKRAFRRIRKETIANVGEEKIFVKYYSPKNFKNFFKNNFEIIETCALSVFAPPPSAAHWHNRKPFLTSLLVRIDRAFERFYPFAFLGDFYICVLKKK